MIESKTLQAGTHHLLYNRVQYRGGQTAIKLAPPLCYTPSNAV